MNTDELKEAIMSTSELKEADLPWPTHVICFRDYENVDATCLSNSHAIMVFHDVDGDVLYGRFDFGV